VLDSDHKRRNDSGRKSQIRGSAHALETRANTATNFTHNEFKDVRSLADILNNTPAGKCRTGSNSKCNTSITRRSGRLYKRCKKAIKPTNRKQAQKPPVIFSLDQLLTNSNNKDKVAQSEASTKYSKSYQSRLSHSDITQNFKRTYIDVMNKVEHNLFENLKQGTVLKSSKTKEVTKSVVIEHGNKVINFIKEVSQSASNGPMELEELVHLVKAPEDVVVRVSAEEKEKLINRFVATMNKLQRDVMKNIWAMDELLYKRNNPVYKVERLIADINEAQPNFCFEHINLICTVFGDLYEVVYHGALTHIRATGVGSFEYEDMLKYRSMRSEKFKEELAKYVNAHIEEVRAKFDTMLDQRLLCKSILFAKSVKFIKPPKIENEDEQKQTHVIASSDDSGDANAVSSHAVNAIDKQLVMPNKGALNQISQITAYVN